MKIINAHLHLIEVGKLLANPKQIQAIRQIPSFSAFKDISQATGILSEKKVLEQMDEAGIERSILFACYAPIIFSSNEFD